MSTSSLPEASRPFEPVSVVPPVKTILDDYGISSQHAMARRCAETGIPIFICKPGEKKPATKHGFYNSTTSLTTIDAWYRENPHYNLAMCPADIGLTVIDVDPGADPAIVERLKETGTYWVRTPRGGYHFYFLGVVPSSTNKIFPHIDVRSEGGYVMLPSAVVNGKEYTVENDADYQSLPPWIAEKIAEGAKKSDAVHTVADVDDDQPQNIVRAEKYLQHCVEIDHVSIVGSGGDVRCFEVAAAVLDLGISVEKTIELMDKLWNPHCRPRQWEYDKLQVKVQNAAKYKQNKGAPNAIEPSQEVFGDTIKKLYPAALQPVYLAELLARKVPPVPELIPGILEKHITTTLSAPGGTHKSRLLLQWLLCSAAEVKIFGRDTMAATCIYLSYEDHQDEVTRRTQAIVKRLNLPCADKFQYMDMTASGKPLAIVTESGVEIQPFYYELRDYLRAITGHKLLGLDSCYNVLQFCGAAKINEASVKAAFELLNRLCTETDSTILMLWHPSQAGQERGDASGWSVAWHNAPRARLSLSAMKDGASGVIKDTFELKVEKRNNAPIGEPLTLHWSDGALLPSTALDDEKQGARLLDACTAVALIAAKSGVPIQGQKHLEGWMLDDIEKYAGFRPSNRQVKNELSRAMHLGRLRYLKGTRHRSAGYYPPDIRDANDLANQAKLSAKDGQQ